VRLAAVVLVSGCVVTPVDPSTKGCPCADGYVCDDGACVACPTGDALDDPAAGVHVTHLAVAWTTTNQMRWEWTSTGDPASLRGYSLLVGATEADVRGCSNGTTLWSAKENPELGRYYLPRTGYTDPVIATTIDGLTASTPYFAKLIATDSSGRQSITNIAGESTGDVPTRTIAVLRDSCPSVWPPDFVQSTQKPFASDAGYRYVFSCTDVDAGECFPNVSCIDDALIQLPDFNAGRLQNAFFEVALAIDSPVPSYWSNLALQFGMCTDCNAVYDRWTLRNGGEYRLMQVPLTAFVHSDGGAITTDEVATGLHQFIVGGYGPVGTVLWVDEASVRY
jgi:hypothetical protein